MDQPTDADRNDDRLISGYGLQRSTVEVVEMGVSDEHEIDRRQVMNMKSGLLQAFDHAQPHRPDRVDQHVGFMGLN